MLQLPGGTPAPVVAAAQSHAACRAAIARTGKMPAAGPGAESRPLPMPKHPLT